MSDIISLKNLQGNIDVGKNKAVVGFIDRLYDSSEKMMLKNHRDWYINDRFVRGEHWVSYNKTLNKLQALPLVGGEIRRTINKIKAQLRGVKNFIKRSQPRWEVHPNGTTPESTEEAIKKNKILQNIYRTRRFPKILTGAITNSLKYSVGIIEGGVIKKDGEDYLDFWVDNTFDVVIDPFCGNNHQNARYIIKTFVKPVTSIKNNKNYTVKPGDKIGDDKEAAAEYLQIIEQEKGNKEGNRTEELETAIVKELWIKYNDENGKPKVRVITICNHNVLRVYDTKYRRYPFFIYNPETCAESIYSDPWIKDLISMNKSLDKTASQVESYIQRMLAGKWLIKKGTEVSTITDNGAEKIWWRGSSAPVQQTLQPLPSTPFTHLANLERWIEEIGGAREASLGRVPGSLQSGKGVEALQAADASTVTEPVENLEKLLEDIGEFVFEVIDDYSVTSETIIEDGEKIKYIGGSADTELSDALIIRGDSEVKVVIVPEISYNEEVKRDWLLRLAEAKIIDAETVLEKMQFSNIGEIIQRVRARKEEEFKEEMTKQRESHRTDGNAPEDTADLADQENMSMASGQAVNPTPRALWTPEHTELHLAFIQQNADAYEQNKDMFDEHIANEETYG